LESYQLDRNWSYINLINIQDISYQLDKYPTHIKLIDRNRINVDKYPTHVNSINI